MTKIDKDGTVLIYKGMLWFGMGRYFVKLCSKDNAEKGKIIVSKLFLSFAYFVIFGVKDYVTSSEICLILLRLSGVIPGLSLGLYLPCSSLWRLL